MAMRLLTGCCTRLESTGAALLETARHVRHRPRREGGRARRPASYRVSGLVVVYRQRRHSASATLPSDSWSRAEKALLYWCIVASFRLMRLTVAVAQRRSGGDRGENKESDGDVGVWSAAAAAQVRSVLGAMCHWMTLYQLLL